MKITAINFNTSFPKLQFASKKNKPPEPQTPHGADYSMLDTSDLLTRSATEIKNMRSSGDDISIDREKLILSRISKAQKDAKKFVEEHPEFCYDDVLQDLICFVVECTDIDLKSDRLKYTQGYQNGRDRYFERLIKNQSSEEAMINELSVSENQESVEDLAINSIIRDYIQEHIVKIISKREKTGERDINIMLMHDMGFPNSHIGEVYNISRETVRTIINNALKDAQRYARHKLS